MPGQIEHGRVMDDAVEGSVLEIEDEIETIADELGDVGTFEQRPGPGIDAANLDDRWVQLDSDNFLRPLRSHARGVAQACTSVQHPPPGRGRLDLAAGVAHGIGVLDAVHRDARDEHGGRSLGGHQRIEPPEGLGKRLHLLDPGVGDLEHGLLVAVDVLDLSPSQAQARGQQHALGREAGAGETQAQIKGDVRFEQVGVTGRQQITGLVEGE